MRLAAALVGASFASLATAVSSAAIYELNSPSPNKGPALEVSPNEARLALAQKLGVTKHYELGVQGANDRRVDILERMGSGSGMFEEKGGQMVISLAGVIPEDAGVLGLNEPILTMKDSPSDTAAKDLISTLAKERSNSNPEALGMITSADSFCATTPSIRNAESIVSASKIANFKSWEVAQEGKIISKEVLDVFKPDQGEDRLFMNEYLMFEAFADHIAPKLDERKSYAFCHLMEIKELVAVYGRYSPQVKLAVKLYHNTLSKIKTKTLVLLTPPTSSESATYGTDAHSHPRRDVSETPLSIAKSSTKPSVKEAPQPIPKPNTSPLSKKAFLQCYAEEEACTTSTNSCSGHGKCVKATDKCWSCKCSPSVKKTDGGLKSSTYWAGYACQKKDISVPFNIFLLFGITMVLVVGTAISMMFSMGSEPLPSVLSAGVAPMKRL